VSVLANHQTTALTSARKLEQIAASRTTLSVWQELESESDGELAVPRIVLNSGHRRKI
jgi:hypothetical protein